MNNVYSSLSPRATRNIVLGLLGGGAMLWMYQCDRTARYGTTQPSGGYGGGGWFFGRGFGGGGSSSFTGSGTSRGGFGRGSGGGWSFGG